MQNSNSLLFPLDRERTPPTRSRLSTTNKKEGISKTLASRYYLDHARELFSFLEQHCQHLLDSDHQHYLHGIHHLSEDAQCLLIRCLARKPKFLKRTSFSYPEIGDINIAFDELRANHYLSYAKASDWLALLPQLTKPQLLEVLTNGTQLATIKITRSSAKAELVNAAQNLLTGNEPCLKNLFIQFSARRQNTIFEYLLFLFFGDLRNRFQQFAMRDLGVKRTHKAANNTARFESIEEAKSAFEYQKMRQEFRLNPAELANQSSHFLLNNSAIGQHAEHSRDQLLLSVGNEIQNSNVDLAMTLWRRSNEPKALEKWVRTAYKNKDRVSVEASLRKLRESDLEPSSQVFIEDFYQRKFNGKKTSIYTDMLRESCNTIGLDEAYVSNVEEGVIGYYQQQGIDAYFTENKFWRTLFYLSLWDILYGDTQIQFSEFDRLPALLKDKNFYQNNQSAIESALNIFTTPELAIQKLTQTIVAHYGHASGLIKWTPEMLDSIRVALQTHARCNDFATMVRVMAQNFKFAFDGYPDLMVIEDGQLRFEEVKAPGDTLRPNQLVSIYRLRSAGFKVSLTQTEWRVNPQQCYAVVDIETTGGRKGGNSITEIAVVIIRNQEIISEWSTLVNPQRHIPAHITRLTGISNSMVTDAPLFAEIADQLRLQLNGCIFVAHNVGFDYGFIKAAYETLGQQFRMPKFCTVSNSRKRFPGLRSYGLGALSEHFDIDLVGHHRALNDAKATAHLLCLIQQQR